MTENEERERERDSMHELISVFLLIGRTALQKWNRMKA